jgi:hypothetical protein
VRGWRWEISCNLFEGGQISIRLPWFLSVRGSLIPRRIVDPASSPMTARWLLRYTKGTNYTALWAAWPQWQGLREHTHCVAPLHQIRYDKQKCSLLHAQSLFNSEHKQHIYLFISILSLTRFDSMKAQKYFLFATKFESALDLSSLPPPPMQGLSRVKRSECLPDHSSASCAKVKHVWIPPIPHPSS